MSQRFFRSVGSEGCWTFHRARWFRLESEEPIFGVRDLFSVRVPVESDLEAARCGGATPLQPVKITRRRLYRKTHMNRMGKDAAGMQSVCRSTPGVALKAYVYTTKIGWMGET